MESCEEARGGGAHIDCEGARLLKETTVNMSEGAPMWDGKQNFDFGAEIVKTQTITTRKEQEEETSKTNTDKSTSESKTTTTTVTSNENVASTITVEECSATAGVQEPELAPTGDKQLEQGAEEKEDEEEADSYQSEDDDDDEGEEDNDNLQQDEEEEQRDSAHPDASQDSDDSSTDSDFSDLSGLSDVSGREWKPISARPINWVQKQIHAGANPRELLSQMLPSSAHQIAPGVNDMMLWRILASMLAEPPRRQKLRYINTFDDVIQLIQQSKNIIVLTGAGVSVSCGIPDFRSSDGIYSRLAKDYPNLPDPQAMFDINFFSRDPRPFFRFAREIYPGQFKPSPCHRFIKLLEQKQKLLRNYTQNIDTLEQVAGIKNVIECHGSFSTASCTKCKAKCSADAIRDDIFAQRIPVCRRCQPNVEQSVDASKPVSEIELRRLVENGIMKPDIVFFGEGLPEEFHTVMASDKDKCDLLIVMGSSLKVRPVALIPSSIPAHVPQILINREQLHHLEFDVELLGDSDVIINQVCHRLGDDWKDICFNDQVLQESKDLLPLEEDTTTEGEDEVQQLLDAETQSVKSNASTDIALHSAGAYSDSGFESSTSSVAVIKTIPPPHEAIEQIKSSILEFNNKSSQNVEHLLPADLLDEPAEAVDFVNRERGFPTFSASAHTYAENARHLSIDSSKDSGIQCDSSSSTTLLNNGAQASSLPPPSSNFNDTGGTAKSTNEPTINVSPATTNTNEATAPTPSAETVVPTNEMTPSNAVARRELKKYASAAERLITGTYYCHESSASYVFPGAQVSWCSDSEEEDEDDDEENENDFGLEMEGDLDANDAPLSPLMPPSVEAEVVSEITTTSAFAICAKRVAESDEAARQNANHSSSSRMTLDEGELACDEPPVKKWRSTEMQSECGEATTAATAFIAHTQTTTTTKTTTETSSGESFIEATETLLQQF